MDKIKSILKPGAKEEDATLYGSEAERAHAGRQTSTVADNAQAARNSESHINDPHEESGVLRQIVNPNHDKYNEAQYGPAGSTTAADTLPPTVSADEKLYTKPEAEKKEHGILRQILNPGGGRADDVAFGQTATTTPPSASQIRSDPSNDQGGIARQILNPSGNQYNETQHGMSSTHNTEGLTGSSSTTGTNADSGLSARVYNGVAGHGSSHDRVVDTAAGPRVPGSSITAPGMASAAVNDGTTSSSLTGSNTGSHHLGRDAALAGGAGAAGLAGVEASRHTGTTGSHHTSNLPQVPSTGGEFMSGSNTGISSGHTGHHHGSTSLTGNDGRAGLAGAAGGALDAESRSRQQVEDGWKPHEHQGHGHKYDGPNIGSEPTPVAGSSSGPHVTRIANLLDPHVGSNSGSTTGSTGLGSHSTTHDSHLGRDAALAGGAGVAAGSALGHNHGQSSTGPASNTVGPHSQDWKNVLDPRVTPNISQQTGGTAGSSSRENESGRGVSHATGDSKVPAAVQRAVPESLERALPDSIHDTSGSRSGAGAAAGAGAAGLAAGSAAGHHGDGTAPGSHTALPHREFTLGTTSDPATQHGVGRDHTTHRDDHSHTGATTGAGLGAAGLAAGSAAHHNTTSGTTTGTSPVTGERGIKSTSANPYSSTGLDPRVDGGSVGSTSHTTSGQTSDGRGVSHATGDSKVPAGIQRAVPEGLERALPDSIHDTSGSRTAGAAGAAGLAGTSAAHSHTGTSSTIPQKDFTLGTTSDPATQHGVGRDHVGGTTTAGSTSHTGKSSSPYDSSCQPTSDAAHQDTDEKHRHFGVPHRHPHDHKQPTPRDTPSIFSHDVKDAQPPKFGDERRDVNTLDYSAQGGAQEKRGLGEHRSHEAGSLKKNTSAVAGRDTASGNTGGSVGGAQSQPGHGANTSSSSHVDSEHHEKKQGFISKLLHRHKDDDEHNKLHKEQH